ncbi:prolyl 4-hydroxylase subunit alpha-1 isoform X1 [Drosophila teissieri]|uniref:prolyl 4-hydroxylase subunit alpha-1 isoform X1 n=1 Tax=Drosophila teissieri TaxID=7243 RepID=UPI001CB9DCF6|nr:prolyl 4-hydroxylase subunit alpha-1 isoform X1 [Drosophila teissieri]
MQIFKLVYVIISCVSLSMGQVEDKEPRFARSVVNMDNLLNMEDDLVTHLEGFTEKLSQNAKTIRWGIQQMKEQLEKNKMDKSLESWDPLRSFSIIRHLQADWLMWKQYLQTPVILDRLIYNKSENLKMPQELDMLDAAEAIRRMQATYGMLSNDIAKGFLDGVQYNSTLAPIDCFAMAQHLMNQSRWTIAEQWILAGIAAQDGKGPRTEMMLLRGPSKSELYRTLGKVRIQRRNAEGALQAYRAALKHSPYDTEIFQEYQKLKRKLLTLSSSKPIGEEPNDEDEEMELPPCCSGHCKVPRQLKRLYCVYNGATAPFLRLAPIKTEFLSTDPFVILLHDMVSPAEAALLRSSSKNMIFPSETVNAANEFEVGKFRTSKSVWLYDGNEATLRLTQRLGEATGLDIRHSEPFQVINYGIGGVFESHFDTSLEDENRFVGGYIDRLATTLFYLNDVPQGGATHFPVINITVFPKFGTALFWYNLDTRGLLQVPTLHTGCPVIVGSKWVVSKWIDDKGQEFRRPCLRSRLDTKNLPSIEKIII